MNDIVQHMNNSYRRAESAIKAWQSEANTDSRFVAGDQSIYNELYGFLPMNRRPRFQFNHMMTSVNQVHGHQIRNRKSLRYTPVENSSSRTADLSTKVLTHVIDRNNGLEIFSDAFRNGSLITGLNLLEISIDWRHDPISGDLVISNNNYNEFFIDPFFRSLDLSDCNFIGKRTYMTKSTACSYLPKHMDLIESLPTGITPDMKFQFMPEQNYINANNLMAYDEFYYRTYREKKLLVEPYGHTTYEWTGTPAQLKKYLYDFPMLKEYRTIVPTVRVAFILQGQLISDEKNPLGIDEFPFAPCVGYFQPHLPNLQYRVQGLARGLRDTQFLYNHRKNISFDIMESQVNSGWIYKPEALRNVNDIFLTGQGRGIPINANFNINEALQKIPSPDLSQANFLLEDGLNKEFNYVSGISEELLATATGEQVGMVAKLRSDASITTLSYLFDNLDRCLKIVGKIILGGMQANYIPSKIERITQEESTDEFYNKNFGKYDCVVEDGLNSSTQRQIKFVQLMALQQALQETGSPIPAPAFMEEVLDAITINDKTKLIEHITQAEQRQQQQQQQANQIQQAQIESQIKLTNARAQADYGLGIERISRINENKQLAVERRAEAEKDRAQSILNLAKAFKEIEDMDINAIERLLSLAKMVKDDTATPASDQDNGVL